MNILFIMAQVMGALMFAAEVIANLQKNQKDILLFNTLSKALEALQYALLWALTGMFLAIFKFARGMLFYWYNKTNRAPSKTVFYILILIGIAIGVATWESGWSAMLILGSLLSLYAQWQTKPRITRIMFFICNLLYASYAFAVMAYTGGVSLVIQSAILALSIYKYDIMERG